MWFSYGITAGANLLALDFVEKGASTALGDVSKKNRKNRSAR